MDNDIPILPNRIPSDNRSSVNRNYALATSAVVEGIPDEQRTSPVRRVYCLLCLFDLICVFIIWVIYTRLVAVGSMSDSFMNQISKFSLSDSMFDIMLLALIRVSIQEVAYGILRARKPWWTAISTTITCGFLLLKIFYYGFKSRKYNKGNASAMDYILMLASFVFCWTETWFLDFRVLPKERAARHLTEGSSFLDDELQSRNNSYQTFLQNEQFFSPRFGTTPARSTYSTVQGSQYHSLGGSPPGGRHNTIFPESDEIELILLKASEAFDTACSLYSDGAEWIHEKGDAIQGCVYSRKVSRNIKIWKLEMLCPVSPRVLFEDFTVHVDKSPSWNTNLLEIRKIHQLNENTDVVYSVTADQLKGAVSQRDFVVVRRWSQISPRLYLVASQSVEHPACPRDQRYIRGHNGVGLVAFEHVTDSEDQCKLTWVINTNLKGWLPQSIVDQASVSALHNTLTLLRNHSEKLATRS